MKLSIVLLDESAAGAFQLLAELSSEKMLHDVLVISQSGETWILDGSDVTEVDQVDLGEFLAGRAIELARVLHLSLSGKAISSSHLELVNQLRGNFKPAGVSVELTSLVVPLANATVEASVFPHYWNYNLLVEPTDMAGEPGFAVLPLSSPEKQLVIAVAAVALCGGLWKWLNEGPLDGGRFRGSSANNAANSDADISAARVRIMRATTRMVDAGNIASQAIAVAFAAGAKFPPPPGCVPHGDDAFAAMELAKAIAPDQGGSYFGLTYRPSTPPPPPRQETLSPLKAIIRFFKEFWEQIRRLPLEMVLEKWTRVKQRVEEVVTNQTYGAESNIRVRFDKDAPLEISIDPARRVEIVSGLAELELEAPPPTPATWSGLMAVILGAADGGDFPDGCGIEPPKWANQRAVIGSADFICHPSLADKDGGCFRVLKSHAELLGWSTEEDLIILGTDSAAAEIVRSRLEEHVRVEPTSSEEESADSKDQQQSDNSKKVVPEELKELSERLNKWISQRSSTLVWKVAESIVRQEHQALDELGRTSADLEEILEQMATHESDEKASRKRFARKAFLILVLLLALLLGGAYGILFVAAVSIVVWIVGLVVGVIGVFWAIMRTARQRVRDAHRLDVLGSRPQFLIERRRNAAQEYVRLASLYRQFQDWTQIAAIELHRPLGNVRQNVVEPWATTVGALSFVCGKPRFDVAKIQTTTFRMMKQLASRGWLTRAYLRQREMIIRKYGEVAGDFSAIDVQPEADVASNGIIARVPKLTNEAEDVVIYGPRTNLLRSLQTELWSGKYRDELIAALHHSVVNAESSDMIETVECDVVGLNVPSRGPRDFLAPIVEWDEVPNFTPMLAARRLVDGVKCGSIVGVSSVLDVKLMAGHRMTLPVLPLEHRFTLASFRLDISDALDLTDVVMINSNPMSPMPEGSGISDDGDRRNRYG